MIFFYGLFHKYKACNAFIIPDIYMKTFYLDIGNSFLKLAEKNESGWNIVCQSESAATLLDCIPGGGENISVITTSVRSRIKDELEKKLPDGSIVTISTDQVPGELLDYDTPATLGMDRYLACLGALSEAGRAVVAVDAGTACTVDLMTADKIYRGGVIMPGLKVYHRSMAVILPELPETDHAVPRQWPGKSTKESIQWGVNGAFSMSVERFIKKHTETVGEADVFVTGGDAGSLKNYLEEKMTIHYRPHLVFEGMSEFLKIRKNG